MQMFLHKKLPKRLQWLAEHGFVIKLMYQSQWEMSCSAAVASVTPKWFIKHTKAQQQGAKKSQDSDVFIKDFHSMDHRRHRDEMLLIVEQPKFSFNLQLITEASDTLRGTCERKGESHAVICPSSPREDDIGCHPTACPYSSNLIRISSLEANYH